MTARMAARWWPVAIMPLLVAATFGPTQTDEKLLVLPSAFTAITAGVALVLAIAHVSIKRPPSWLVSFLCVTLAAEFALRAIEFSDAGSMPFAVSFWGNVSWVLMSVVMTVTAVMVRQAEADDVSST